MAICTRKVQPSNKPIQWASLMVGSGVGNLSKATDADQNEAGPYPQRPSSIPP